MFVLTMKFDKKKAVFIVLIVAAILIGIVLLAGAHSSSAAAENTMPAKIKNEGSGAEYLMFLGWEIETPALNTEVIVIPRTFSSVFEEYNELQKEQGFDLSRYCGNEVSLYTYKVKNAGNENETVVAQIYVYKGDVIGGDIHSTALDGFIKGIK